MTVSSLTTVGTITTGVWNAGAVTITAPAATDGLTVTGASGQNIVNLKESGGRSVLTLDNSANLTLGNTANPAIEGSLILVDIIGGHTATVQAAFALEQLYVHNSRHDR